MSVRAYHVLLALAVACLVVGSGAFTSAELDREISVSVADDDSAYVGISTPTSTAAVAPTETSETATTTESADSGTTAPDSGTTTTAEAESSGQSVSTETPTADRSVTLLTVTNRFDEPVEVTVEEVTQESTGPTVVESSVSGASKIPVGEKGSVDATVTCGTTGGDATVTLTLRVDGLENGVSVEMTRPVTVSCG